MSTWVYRWGQWVSNKPHRPGIYKLKEGGYLVRSLGKQRNLTGGSLDEALRVHGEIYQRRSDVEMPLWSSFAAQLFREKCHNGEIESLATVERWKDTLERFLIPVFGHLAVDEVTNATIAEWKDQLHAYKLANSTLNGILRVLRTVCAATKVRYRLEIDPFPGTKMFREKSPYGIDTPNSLPPDVLRQWLDFARELYPQHYAMMVLGFVTGRRPGELRALKRIDIRWASSRIVISRSHSRKQVTKQGTKTGTTVVVTLPSSVMDILRDHLQALPPGVMRDSVWLFPSTEGGIRSRSALDKPFKKLKELCNINYKVTPRAMRRSFQDLARAAAVEGVTARSISGHKTEKMQDHYSTVGGGEQQESLDRMGKLVIP